MSDTLGRLRRLATIATAVALGIGLGVGAYTFIYAQGYAYLGRNPEACANCHVMREQLSGWVAGGHRHVADCNDCHTPSAPIAKLYTKASNGFWHSFYFTTGGFPDQIRIRPHNERVTERRCRECHMDVVFAMVGGQDREEATCIRCHRDVGHL